MRRLSIFIGLFIIIIGITLFHVKYKVVGLEQELAFTNRKIIESQQSIHILKAEWEHLNNPARLQQLAQKHLHLVPFNQTHYVVLSQIPFREDPVVSLVEKTLRNENIKSAKLHQKTHSKESLMSLKTTKKRTN